MTGRGTLVDNLLKADRMAYNGLWGFDPVRRHVQSPDGVEMPSLSEGI
jgi:hypothetical protein